MAVLVKSEKGSIVLVKAKKKSRRPPPDVAKYSVMWDWVFGEGGNGLEGLYTDIDAKNRKGAKGRSGKQLTTFPIKPHPKTKDPKHAWYDPDGTSGHAMGASRKELNTLIEMGNLIEAHQHGDPAAAAQLEKSMKSGHFDEQFLDHLLNNPKVQEGAMKLGMLARESHHDRQTNKELQTYTDKEGVEQHKTHHSVIDPVTGIASRRPRSGGDRPAYQSVRSKKNPDFIDLSTGSGADDGAAASLFGIGGDDSSSDGPTEAAMDTMRPRSTLNPDGTVDRSKGQDNTESCADCGAPKTAGHNFCGSCGANHGE